MQDSNKNQGNLGNKNLNQSNQKQPIQNPGQAGTDKKFTKDADIKTGKNVGTTQQDRSSKR